MQPPINEVRIPVVIDRDRTLLFNLNMMSKYEEITKNSYWTTITKMIQFYRDNLGTLKLDDEKALEKYIDANFMGLMAKLACVIPVRDQHALLYAACHEYDGNDEPSWPLTLGQLGRFIKPGVSLFLLSQIIAGHMGNSPTKKELGEVSGLDKVKTMPAIDSRVPKTEDANSGRLSNVLDVSALGLLKDS